MGPRPPIPVCKSVLVCKQIFRDELTQECVLVAPLHQTFAPHATRRSRIGPSSPAGPVPTAATASNSSCATWTAPCCGGRRWRSRARSLVVYRGLARAVRRETALAVAYHWGVGLSTVTAWRKALGVPAVTDGIRQAKRDHFAEPWADDVREKAQAKVQDPRRREKIAARKQGKPRPAHVVAAMIRRRGARPWTDADDLLVQTLPPAEPARRTLGAVYRRRQKLNLTRRGPS
jgi:hypothetical protein